MSASTAAPVAKSRSTALNVALWIGQLILAVMFGPGGFMKAVAPFETLHAQVPWTPHVPDMLVRFIGVSEFLGAVGVILPAITRIKPQLVPLAALGLMVVMLLASGFHIMRGEFEALPFTIGLAVVAAFVAWGRARKLPIAPRRAPGGSR